MGCRHRSGTRRGARFGRAARIGSERVCPPGGRPVGHTARMQSVDGTDRVSDE
ncbi:hypothetical protein YT1_2070 [Rhodococcus ruber]|nr:hypothetical protein YT1_2070 [Rhodococcus ruber]